MRLKLIFLLNICSLFVFCNEENRASAPAANKQNSFRLGDTVTDLGKNIDFIFQDKDSIYWFASNGEGIYRYDGKTILHLTDQHGLCSNFVWEIQEDVNGNLWFSTRDGICKLNGSVFVNYTDSIKNAAYGKLKYKVGGLFFNHLNGICFYDGYSFTNFTIHPAGYTPNNSSMYRPYGVYCTLADNNGKVWFGTQEKGVGVYGGDSITFITGKDLDGPAVRAIFQDKAGDVWFGNNGGGLYRFSADTLQNMTEEKELGNEIFLNGKQMLDLPGSLARVFAIQQDKQGNLWIGTADAGVWNYDGTNLSNYTTKDGLSSLAVTHIYRDRQGELWFVSNGDAILKFDGQRFIRVKFNH